MYKLLERLKFPSANSKRIVIHLRSPTHFAFKIIIIHFEVIRWQMNLPKFLDSISFLNLSKSRKNRIPKFVSEKSRSEEGGKKFLRALQRVTKRQCSRRRKILACQQKKDRASISTPPAIPRSLDQSLSRNSTAACVAFLIDNDALCFRGIKN